MKISVLMSVYGKDNPDYLAIALDSIANQTQAVDEVIIVEDGLVSPQISEVINSYRSTLNIVSVCLHDNVGLGQALRAGLLKCAGDFVARMDSDDISHPLRIEKQSSFLMLNPEIAVIGSAIVEIDKMGNHGKTIYYPQSHSECHIFFKKRDPVAHPAVMFRKDFIDRIGSYKPFRKDQDTELWFRVLLNGGKFANLSTPLLFFRRTESFWSKRSNLDRVVQYFQMRVKINRKLKFGLISQIYTFIYCLVMLLPPRMKRFLYDFRNNL